VANSILPVEGTLNFAVAAMSPVTERLLPIVTKFRTDKELPKDAKSKTDKHEPKRAFATTDKADPRRAN